MDVLIDITFIPVYTQEKVARVMIVAVGGWGCQWPVRQVFIAGGGCQKARYTVGKVYRL